MLRRNERQNVGKAEMERTGVELNAEFATFGVPVSTATSKLTALAPIAFMHGIANWVWQRAKPRGNYKGM